MTPQQPPARDPDPALHDAMLAEAQAQFALAVALRGIELTDREREVADTGIAAGVVGALAVLRATEDPHT